MTATDVRQKILYKLLWIRFGQLVVNEMYKTGAFKIPIHLAFGHEAIAVAVDAVMGREDQLILAHRNIHYNLARVDSLKLEIDEYLLKEGGLAQGMLGSMNLSNEAKGIVYSSSILGNNLAVAAGYAVANGIKNKKSVVFVITGDGAMEEGTFYESLVFEKNNALPVIVIIENNQWSLATRIEERRCSIDIRKLAESLDVPFEKLHSNDACEYVERLGALRSLALDRKTPVCVEVSLSTLGSRYQKTVQCPEGKFINYHAGPISSITKQGGPYVTRSNEDPVFVMENYFKEDEIMQLGKDILAAFEKELV